ncbi:MAG: hypothetical protein ACYSWR_03715 [Planctomycetota bacterium]
MYQRTANPVAYVVYDPDWNARCLISDSAGYFIYHTGRPYCPWKHLESEAVCL